jgi:hypothetical protein
MLLSNDGGSDWLVFEISPVFLKKGAENAPRKASKRFDNKAELL